MPSLRLALAQLNTVVGDLGGNVRRILTALSEAERVGADLCLFPELAVTGYPPEDLLLRPRFVADNLEALEEVAAATGDCVAVVGFVERIDQPGPGIGFDGRDDRRSAPLANAAAVCTGGQVVGIYRKRLLPNYGVFDERRWFVPGAGPHRTYTIAGVQVGVSICEDAWSPGGPVADLGAAGAELVANINASPFSRGRRAERLEVLRARVAESGCAIAYVNQVGGQDELVFDGASLVLGADGSLVAAGRQFVEDLVVVDLALPAGQPAPNGGRHAVPGGVGGGSPVMVSTASRCRGGPEAPPTPKVLSPEGEVYEALVLGTHDYLEKNGFTDAVVALSGGIDSSLVATVAVDALGASHVHGLSMPSRYSSEGSRTDAAELAARLGIDLEVLPIEPAHLTVSNLLEPVLGGGTSGLTDENLQSRLRGLLLMAVSNANGWIVLSTGNKSEMATGYSTLYGDSVGGFAVIKDVPKTLVYAVCRYRNARDGGPGPIPESVLSKPPSAELRPGQRDDQSLPPYDELDPVLALYVEQDRGASDIVAAGYDPAIVDRVVRLVDNAEYKRRQMPPGVRITAKAFGKDRRMPITNRYGSGVAARPAVVVPATGERHD